MKATLPKHLVYKLPKIIMGVIVRKSPILEIVMKKINTSFTVPKDKLKTPYKHS